MFGKKKKKEALINSVDDTRTVVYDFKRRIPYESYRAMEYRPFPDLEEEVMIPKLDVYLNKLFAGAIDDGNGDVLDNLIFKTAREAGAYLKTQNIDHRDMNNRFTARAKADQEDFTRIYEQVSQETRKLENELEITSHKLAAANGEEEE